MLYMPQILNYFLQDTEKLFFTRATSIGSPSLALSFRSINLSVHRQRRKSDYPQRPLGIATMKTRLRTKSSSYCTIDAGACFSKVPGGFRARKAKFKSP